MARKTVRRERTDRKARTEKAVVKSGRDEAAVFSDLGDQALAVCQHLISVA